jgi:PAS domain S-box-containing protein
MKDMAVDLVITDFALPNSGGEIFSCAGLAVLSYVALQTTNTPKVIAVTGAAIIADDNQPFKHLLECALLIQKPFEVNTIVECGLNLLEQKADEERQGEMGSIAESYATDPVIWFREDGTLYSANSQTCNLLGYSSQELTQNPIGDLFLPEDLETLRSNLQRIKMTKSLRFGLPVRHKDKSVVDYKIDLHLVVVDQGERLIFARLEKLQEETRLLGAAVKSTQDAFLIAKVESASDSTLRVFFHQRSLLPDDRIYATRNHRKKTEIDGWPRHSSANANQRRRSNGTPKTGE